MLQFPYGIVFALLMILIVPTAAADCRPIEGISGVLQPGLVLVLGELHGTQESPAFVADVACHATTAGLAVVVGVELPTAESGRIDAFLNSMGTPEDRALVISGERWQSDYQDGRTSLAMLDMLDALRHLQAAGKQVRVVPFDVGGAGGGQARDRGMGNTLAALVKSSPSALAVILTGNQHSRITPGRARNVAFEPMTYVMAQQVTDKKLIALDVGYGDGSAWICAPGCGVSQLSGMYGERSWAIEIGDATRSAGHHGRYFVGRITASPPAAGLASAVSLESAADDVTATARAQRSPTPLAPTRMTGKLSRAESRFQGLWQSYDYNTNSQAWKMRFTERSFRAEAGPDEWYEGYVSIRDDTSPAQIDITIEDCLCDLKGQTSAGIYYEEDGEIVISAPSPGWARPNRFIKSNEDMLRLRRIAADED